VLRSYQRRGPETIALVNSIMYHRSCPIHFHVVSDHPTLMRLRYSFWNVMKGLLMIQQSQHQWVHSNSFFSVIEPQVEISYYDIEWGLKQYCEFPDKFHPHSRIKVTTFVIPVFPFSFLTLIIGMSWATSSWSWEGIGYWRRCACDERHPLFLDGVSKLYSREKRGSVWLSSKKHHKTLMKGITGDV